MQNIKKILWFNFALLTLGLIVAFGHTIAANAVVTTAAEMAPQPEEKPFVGTDILGVASRYNAFAADKMIIDGTAINDGLEGRYAAGEFEDLNNNTWNSGKSPWGSVLSMTDPDAGVIPVTPLITTNKIQRLKADNKTETGIFKDVYKSAGGQYLYNGQNQLVANNLLDWYTQEHDGWDENEKKTYQHLGDILKVTDGKAEKVGQTADFKKNQAVLQRILSANGSLPSGMSGQLDPDATDASNYFYAAKLQIQAISKYYDQLTIKKTGQDSENVVLVNSQVDNVKVNEKSNGNTLNLTVDLYLPDDYAKDGNYQKPPVLLLGLKNQSKQFNVTVNVHNMDGSIKEVQAGNDSYPTYAYAPYILANWDGINSTDLFGGWNGSYKMNAYNKDNQEIQPPSGTSQGQLYSSHVLNNFPNVSTSGDDSVEFKLANNGLSGTILVPNASVKQSKPGAGAELFGSVITGKDFYINSSLPVSRLISSSFDFENIPGDIFEDLKRPNPQATKVSLKTDEDQSAVGMSVGEHNKVPFSIKSVKELAPLTLDADILTRNQDYQVWYRWKNASGDHEWHNLADEKSADIDWQYDAKKQKYNHITIPDLRKLQDYSTALKQTSKSSQSVDYLPTAAEETPYLQLQRQNTFELLVAPTEDGSTGKEVKIDPKATDQDLEDYQITTIDLAEKGNLEFTVPGQLALKPDQQKQTLYQAKFPVTIKNPWQINYRLGLGFNSQMTSPAASVLYPIESNADAATFTIDDQDKLNLTPASETTPQVISDQMTGLPAAKKQFNLDLSVNLPQQMIDFQPGNTYYYPFRWTLNYQTKAADKS